MSQQVEEAIMALLSQVRDGKSTDASISPNDVARLLQSEKGDPLHWQNQLPKVKAVAVGLARQGKLDILRKGKPVDPNGVKGLYRIRLAANTDVAG